MRSQTLHMLFVKRLAIIKKAVEILKQECLVWLVNPDMKAGYFAMLRVRNIDQYYYGEKD